MDSKEKIKAGFAENLLRLLDAGVDKNGKKISLRKLSLLSELEYSHVQRISKGAVDLSLTTIFALAQGLEIEPKELLDF